ncbi:YicC/YloC family endoribonuclease [Pseudoxanthomonas winnipegensis]|uniref:YicC family protein n=1 Tax=Pseudoxanthomonas winnipegensis TaxID=2480810 RepID=A0A4Q8LLA2_9GAMM|nr:YicC/YloC family endoribonuclease [Pseudoxanthomonas winnipegensis]RZZ86172.1 YicC family protein [Pseudoxanthomonas winnipegensis]TAA12193.1 YicC family protein [Pseudoxanthomonas winnipegensis]TAA19441.1 YicC family protein [Pseudoxanthomonas winnipegensis]TAA31309.1 YicC family protein [Pseudoxanthomonas winnipegensis]TAA41187.1 YicC family protein [Pseudoxanthomonas winnipegensis]
MIRSMTAYATVEQPVDGGALSAELRAVNHRFLELSLRLPDELRALEPALRERVAARVGRGKLDLVLRLRTAEGEGGLHLDQGMVDDLAAVNAQLAARFPGLRTSLTELLQFPGVLRSRALDAEALQAAALALLERLLDQFVDAREREGGKLAQAIAERVDAIAARAAEARTLIPQIRAGQRQKLEARLAELAQPADPGRLEQELVLSLQKLDVDEELDRLDSHIKEIRRVLKGEAAVGRRLDFLLQEFNREANTLGSKSVDVRTTNIAVELKVLIDQIREQVQNLE